MSDTFSKVWQGLADSLERSILIGVARSSSDLPPLLYCTWAEALDEDESGGIQRYEWESVLDKARRVRFRPRVQL